MRAHLASRAGFSMVEVALALLVVGVGLLAVFGLFAGGLDINKKTIEDTQAALFADEVLNGFRAAAQACTNSTSWNTLPTTINLSIPVVWNTPRTIMPGAAFNTINYQYTATGLGTLKDYAFRYRFQVAPSTNSGSVMTATLTVTPAAVSTSTNVFYTEACYSGQ